MLSATNNSKNASSEACFRTHHHKTTMDSALYLHESLPAAFFSEPVVIHPGKSGSRTVENAAFSASTPMLCIPFCYV